MAGGASSPTPPSPRFTLPTPPPQAPGYFGGGMAMGGGMPPTGGGFEAAQARLLPLAGTAAAPQIGNFFARQGAGMSQPQAPRFTLPELEWNAAAEPMPTGGGGGGGGGGNLGKGFSVLTNLAGSFGGDFSPAWQTGKKLFSGLGKLF